MTLRPGGAVAPKFVANVPKKESLEQYRSAIANVPPNFF